MVGDRPTTEAAAIAWLVAQVPELRPLLDEHVEGNGGELLPYVAFEGEFLRGSSTASGVAIADPPAGSSTRSSR